jgi:hypothetical protein
MAQTKTVHESWSESSRLATIQSLVERGTWRIDASPYGHETGDKILLDGHYYSSKPPLFAAIGALLYAMMYYGWQTTLAFEGCPPGTFCVYYWLTVLMVGLPSALLASFLYRLLAQYGGKAGWAMTLTALFCFGTVIWPYSLVLNNHLPAAVALFFSFYLLVGLGPSRYRFLGAGLLVGLAVMFDLTSIFLALALFLMVILYHRDSLLLFMGAAMIPAIPSFIFNYQITGGTLFPYFSTEGYHYPGSTFDTLGGQHPPDNLLVYTFRNFVGDQGLLAYCPLLLFAGWGLIQTIRDRYRPLSAKSVLILLGLMGHVAFILTRTHNFGGDAYGGRYFIPFIPILYFFTAFVIPTRFYKPKGGWLAALWGVTVLVSLFSAYQGVRGTWHSVNPPLFMALRPQLPYLTIQSNLDLPEVEPPLHLAPTPVRNFDLPAMDHRLDVNFNNELLLLGYDLPTRRIKPGQTLDIVLYWQLLRVVQKDYFVFTHLLDTGQMRQGGLDRHLQEGYPVAFWYPGEIVTDQRQIPINPDATNSLAWLRIGGYQLVDGQAETLPLITANRASEETSIAVGPILIGASPQLVNRNHFAPQRPLAIKLGEPSVILLHGYDLTQEGNQLQLTLYWESLTQTSFDWTTFVHLRNETGEIVAQKDSQTGGGLLPTSLWDSGEIIADPVQLIIPLGLAAGEYRLVGGLYQLDTGQRLAVPASSDNSFELTILKLKE